MHRGLSFFNCFLWVINGAEAIISSSYIVLYICPIKIERDNMVRAYSNELKNKICVRICKKRESTSMVAKEMDIPLKTVEKWVTAYYKDPKVFEVPEGYIFEKRRLNAHRYDSYTREQLIRELKRKDTKIVYLQSVIESKN